MVNIPTIGFGYVPPGGTYSPPGQPTIIDDIEFSYKETTLIIKKDGDVIIEGNAKDAAIALFNYVLLLEKSEGSGYVVLHKVRVFYKKEISIIYPFQDVSAPDDFINLKMEFDKLVKLIVFA